MQSLLMVNRRGRSTPLGYRQARALLRGEMIREEAIVAAQQGHRNYAKRQLERGFGGSRRVHWLKGFWG